MAWHYLTLNCRGAQHQAAGESNQDFSAVYSAHGALLIAVADGAGSAPLAAWAAYLAVTAAGEAWRHPAAASRGPTERLLLAVSHARQTLQRQAEILARPLADFATTLLLLELAAQGGAAAHIGDGGIVGLSQGQLELLSPPQHRGPANTTNFLTDSDWRRSLRVTPLASRPEALAVFTDGLEFQILAANGQPLPQFFHPAFTAVRSSAPASWFYEQLAAPQLAQLTGDDITLVLAHWKECSHVAPQTLALTPNPGPV